MPDGIAPAAAGNNAFTLSAEGLHSLRRHLIDAREGVETAEKLCSVSAVALQHGDVAEDVADILGEQVYVTLKAALSALERIAELTQRAQS